MYCESDPPPTQLQSKLQINILATLSRAEVQY